MSIRVIDLVPYDKNDDERIDLEEVMAAIADYSRSLTDMEEALQLLGLYLAG